jgi:hypothetical protein
MHEITFYVRACFLVLVVVVVVVVVVVILGSDLSSFQVNMV